MVVSRNKHEQAEYVLLAERKAEPAERTVFQISALSNKQMLALAKLGEDGNGHHAVEVAVRAGLRGWRNFLTPDGAETEFRRDSRKVVLHGVEIDQPVSEATFECIPPDVLLELSKAITNFNQVDADAAKN